MNRIIILFVLFFECYFTKAQSIIYVTDLKDVRLMAYKDSLKTYNYRTFFLSVAKSIRNKHNLAEGNTALKKEEEYSKRHNYKGKWRIISIKDSLLRNFAFNTGTCSNTVTRVPYKPIKPKIKVIYKSQTRYRISTKIVYDLDGNRKTSTTKTIIANKVN